MAPEEHRDLLAERLGHRANSDPTIVLHAQHLLLRARDLARSNTRTSREPARKPISADVSGAVDSGRGPLVAPKLVKGSSRGDNPPAATTASAAAQTMSR